MEVEETWIRNALKKMSGNDDASVRRIDNVVKESALAKGENYLSTISRTSADVWLSSGEIQKVSCILKDQHQSPLLKQMSVEAGFFLREIEVGISILLGTSRPRLFIKTAPVSEVLVLLFKKLFSKVCKESQASKL